MAIGMGKFIGGIKFGVSMDTRKLHKDVKVARSVTQKFVGHVKTSTAVVGALGTAAAGAFGVVVKSQFDAIDSLAKVSDKLGITTEKLAGLRHAAEQSGVAQNTLDTALQRMIRRTSEAAKGVGEAQGAIKELGLDAKALAALSPDQQFAKIAGAMTNVKGQSNKVRLAFKLFDSEGVALVNTLKLGTTGLDQMQKEAQSLGLAISRVEAAQIEAANDAVDSMQKAFVGVARTVAVRVAPVVTDVADQIREWTTQTTAFKSAINGVNVGGGALGKIADIVKVLKDGFLGLRAVVTKTISFVVNIFDKFAKTIAGYVRQFQGIPGIGDKASSLANSLDSGFLDAFNRNLKQQSKLTGAAFWDSFMSETPSERIARKAAQAVNGADIAKSPEMKTFNALKHFGGNLFGQGKNAIAGFGQMGQGVGNLPLVQALPWLLGKYFSNLQAGLAAPSQSGFRGSLSFAEAGSAESFRQRARIRNQRNQQKLDKQRNADLAAIKRAVEKGGMQLAPANFGGR